MPALPVGNSQGSAASGFAIATLQNVKIESSSKRYLNETTESQNSNSEDEILPVIKRKNLPFESSRDH